MAIAVRQLADAVVYALVTSWNQFRGNATVVGVSVFHADITSTTTGDNYFLTAAASLQVTAATAADLPTCIALANNIQSVMQVHWKDGISTNKYSAGAHKIPDTTNNTVQSSAVDLPSVVVLANAMKAQINAHFTQAGVHFNNDGTNTIGTANATDLASSITLLNVIKTNANAHLISAPAGSQMINIVAA